MTPPIRRGDGTTLAPSGIAQVRAGDGDVYYERNVIPDSTIAQYDATQESTGGIASITDQIGSFDLSADGDPQVISSGINSKQTFRFDGTGDIAYNASNYVTSNVDFAVIFVFEFQESPNTNDYVLGTEGNALEFALQDNGSPGEFQIHRGGSGNVSTGYNPDQDAHIGVVEGFDGGNAKLRIDGSDSSEGEITTNDSDLEGLAFAGRDSSDTDKLVQIDFGEMVVLEDYASSDITSEESRLSNKWGVAI